jgi:hypothetical protein
MRRGELLGVDADEASGSRSRPLQQAQAAQGVSPQGNLAVDAQSREERSELGGNLDHGERHAGGRQPGRLELAFGALPLES